MSIVQKSQKSLEYDKILSELSVFAKTEQSRKICLDLTPFVRHSDIEEQLILTREAKDILDLAHDIPIERIQDFKLLQSKNEYFVEEELVDIAKTMRTSRLIRNFLKENLPFEATMHKLTEELFSNKELEDKIFDTFDENYAVKQNANPDLKGLYSSLKDTEINLKQRVQELMNSPEFQKQKHLFRCADLLLLQPFFCWRSALRHERAQGLYIPAAAAFSCVLPAAAAAEHPVWRLPMKYRSANCCRKQSAKAVPYLPSCCNYRGSPTGRSKPDHRRGR